MSSDLRLTGASLVRVIAVAATLCLLVPIVVARNAGAPATAPVSETHVEAIRHALPMHMKLRTHPQWRRRAEPARVPLAARVLDAATVQRLVHSAAAAVGLSPAFVSAIMLNESARNANATSPAGALGLMQLMPAVAREWGAREPYDIYQNVYAGARYLAWLRQRYHGNVTLAAAAYNAGPGTVDRYHGVPPYPETRSYVAGVLAAMNAEPPEAATL